MPQPHLGGESPIPLFVGCFSMLPTPPWRSVFCAFLQKSLILSMPVPLPILPIIKFRSLLVELSPWATKPSNDKIKPAHLLKAFTSYQMTLWPFGRHWLTLKGGWSPWKVSSLQPLQSSVTWHLFTKPVLIVSVRHMKLTVPFLQTVDIANEKFKKRKGSSVNIA